jgi:glycosyltransferase involved in cell wall biosynthesis
VKILHTVQRYAPDTGGSEEVVKQLSEYLVSFGHDVTVATGASPRRTFDRLNGVKIVEFDCAGNAVEGFRGEVNAFREFIRSTDADVMMNYAAQIWSSDLVFDLLPSLVAKKVFVPCGYSRLHDPLFAGYFSAMPDVLRRYDKVIYLSDNYVDTAFGAHHGLRNGITIPNGADLREFSTVRRGAFRSQFNIGDKPLIINVSNHSSLKGHAFFWNCIAQLDDLHAASVLIGNPYVGFPKKWFTECYAQCRLRSLRKNALLLEGLPRSSVVSAYVDADVFLFGSRVECSPLVMFEAFAGKTLFVTTDCGNVKDYKDIVCIVGTEEEAVSVIREFFQYPDRYADRLAKGFTLFQQETNWYSIARRYENLYLDLTR